MFLNSILQLFVRSIIFHSKKGISNERTFISIVSTVFRETMKAKQWNHYIMSLQRFSENDVSDLYDLSHANKFIKRR